MCHGPCGCQSLWRIMCVCVILSAKLANLLVCSERAGPVGGGDGGVRLRSPPAETRRPGLQSRSASGPTGTVSARAHARAPDPARRRLHRPRRAITDRAATMIRPPVRLRSRTRGFGDPSRTRITHRIGLESETQSRRGPNLMLDRSDCRAQRGARADRGAPVRVAARRRRP